VSQKRDESLSKILAGSREDFTRLQGTEKAVKRRRRSVFGQALEGLKRAKKGRKNDKIIKKP